MTDTAFEQHYTDLLEIPQAARELGIGESTARRILRNEPGVIRLVTPGRTRPMIRIPRAVLDRLRLRMSVPARRV